MSVDEEHARTRNPIGTQIFRAQGDLPVAFPENGALAGFLVNEDEGRLAHAARGYEPVRIDTLTGHFGLLKFPGFVVAYFADVSGTQAPALAGGDSACRLSSWAALSGENLDFRIERGEIRKADDGIGGVDTDADDIDMR